MGNHKLNEALMNITGETSSAQHMIISARQQKQPYKDSATGVSVTESSK